MPCWRPLVVLRPELRAATFRTLIGLMAATGIRTGEAIGLGHRQPRPGRPHPDGHGEVRQDPDAPVAPNRRRRPDRLPPPTRPAAARSGLPRAADLQPTAPDCSHPMSTQTFRDLAQRAGLRPASSVVSPEATRSPPYLRGLDHARRLPIRGRPRRRPPGPLDLDGTHRTPRHLLVSQRHRGAVGRRDRTSRTPAGPHGERSRS